MLLLLLTKELIFGVVGRQVNDSGIVLPGWNTWRVALGREEGRWGDREDKGGRGGGVGEKKRGGGGKGRIREGGEGKGRRGEAGGRGE